MATPLKAEWGRLSSMKQWLDCSESKKIALKFVFTVANAYFGRISQPSFRCFLLTTCRNDDIGRNPFFIFLVPHIRKSKVFAHI
jgi:hypothetical protein